jgi:hypothetical protein
MFFFLKTFMVDSMFTNCLQDGVAREASRVLNSLERVTIMIMESRSSVQRCWENCHGSDLIVARRSFRFIQLPGSFQALRY